MRISTQSQISIMANSAVNNHTEQLKIGEQLKSGKRINSPSEDPISSTMFMQLESENLKLEQYDKNILTVKNNIKIQEVNIESASEMMGEIKNVLIKAQLPSNSADDYKSYAQEIDNKTNFLVEILNKKNMDGRYIYSGTMTGEKPVIYNIASQKYEYKGNESIREIIVGNGMTEKDGAQLHHAFASASEQMKVLTDLKALSKKLINSGASSSADIQTSIDSVEIAASKLDGIVGDFISRKANLNILQSTQKQTKQSNVEFGKSLVGMTVIEQGMLKVRSQEYLNILTGTMKMHIKMTQFSIFNLMS
ncbi:flagellin N-terminal helical domain-containing protein [Yersinia enterocolitica]|uniref:flagellin N-terminal helical domain-containing protein n=1 Tax=Yersinia enterocolitica TaxID=630 RepID=UPI00398CF73C